MGWIAAFRDERVSRPPGRRRVDGRFHRFACNDNLRVSPRKDPDLAGTAKEITKRMLDPELLDILVCPETRTPLRMADDDLLTALNRAVEGGAVRNRRGELLTDPVTAGLVREDGAVLYPIRDGIPIMLIDEALSVGNL